MQRPSPGPHQNAAPTPTRRWNIARDLTAAALLVVALLLPWNLYFGLGILGSNKAVLAVLFAATLLSLISIAVAGSWRSSSARFNPALAGRLRLALNIPYALLVLGFVAFDVFETVRFGGTVNVPGGVGPGAWLGIAGSLLGAQPVTTGPKAPDDADDTVRPVRIIGYASIVGAALSFGFNLFWRVRFALQSTGGSSDFGKQNIAVIATAVVYGVVALVAVLVASRWLVRSTKASQLATIALGTSTLVAGILVWGLPVGRDIDAFHGIAQNTSTAGVGYEGYLAWAAAAAILAPPRLFAYRNTSSTDENAWRAAARNGLLLIIVWCLGSTIMRITDLIVAVSLNYPFSRYDTMVLAAFDLATAALAIWLRINLGNDSVSTRLISSLCGLVAALTISRVVVGVALAPRFQESPGAAQNPVYGNDLAQQITSTFDVVLCGLALGILIAAIITGQLSGRRLRRQRRRAARKRAVPPGAQPHSVAATTRIPVGHTPPPSAAATTRIPTRAPAPESPTTAIPQLARSPRIFRGPENRDSATRQIPVPKPGIFRPPHDST
ncbi:MAG: hypothetical protein ACLP4W_02925 [Mycobacterium sp.]|uniref:DUF7937 domain-containing protein n=1 Tax=Mycobacterium sp. TaxID=1785 RepID=UPI003F9AA3D3